MRLPWPHLALAFLLVLGVVLVLGGCNSEFGDWYRQGGTADYLEAHKPKKEMTR